MTSQIALFNQRGVAVASDTIVTLTSEGGTRTVGNRQKLWLLGETHLVVVAVSGNITINQVDGRVLVAEWSKTLKSPLATVHSYAESFVSWLNSKSAPISVANEMLQAQEILSTHFGEIGDLVIEEAPPAEATTEFAKQTLLRVTKESIENLEAVQLFAGVDDDSDAKLLAHSDVDVDALMNSVLDGFPGLDDARDVLRQSGALALSRAHRMPGLTAIAFIGFGAEEQFATSVRLQCRGRYGGVMRATIDPPFGVSLDNLGGAISFFAQQDAMQGFLRGVDSSALDLITRHFWTEISERMGGEDEGVSIATEIVRKVRSAVLVELDSEFVHPMLDTMSSLSLGDLAELATALVGIQAMRANASPTPPGVGGLIETLVIDRADGIRWLQRLPR